MITADTDHWCKDLRRMLNKTTAGLVCLLKEGSGALKMGTKMGMEPMRDRERRSSKMERLGTRTVRSRRKKHRRKTENLNTATRQDMEQDKQMGSKAVVLEQRRERKLHTC